MIKQHFLNGNAMHLGLAVMKKNTGFSYIGLLVVIGIMGIMMMTTTSLWSFTMKREKERELLFAGNQFKRAIGLYYERTPGQIKQYPKTLEDLLDDKRAVTTQRYLRKVYHDPITGSPDWGLVIAPDGGVMGVYSQSKSTPIKKVDAAKQYVDWKFIYLPGNPASPPLK